MGAGNAAVSAAVVEVLSTDKAVIVATDKAVITTSIADRINEAHALARQSAQTAAQHAVRAGDLLLEQKSRLPHGEFGAWVKTNCPTLGERTARLYMQAAKQNGNALPISSLRSLFGTANKKTTSAEVISQKDINTKSDLVKKAVTALRNAYKQCPQDPVARVECLTWILIVSGWSRYMGDTKDTIEIIERLDATGQLKVFEEDNE